MAHAREWCHPGSGAGGFRCRPGVLCALGEHLERGRMIHSQVREALAIEADTGGLETVDELAVAQSVQPRGRVDAHDPHAAEIALLAAAAGVGIVQRLVDGLLGGLIQLALGGVEPLRALQQFLALGASNGSSLYAGHLQLLQKKLAVKRRERTGTTGTNGIGTVRTSALSSRRSRRWRRSRRCRYHYQSYGSILFSLPASAGEMTVVPRAWRFRRVGLLVRMWRLNALPRRNFPLAVFLKRFAAPRWLLIFGTVFLRGDFVPAALPLRAHSRGPIAPLCSRGSLTCVRSRSSNLFVSS